MTPAEYLYAARIAFSKREPEHGQALCETLDRVLALIVGANSVIIGEKIWRDYIQ